MRVTNSMINRNSMRNMNHNKASVDRLNTQMTTQKKIQRPSEDPVTAIRSLRLRSDLSEVNQFYGKNIPDAESWLELTEAALSNMETIITDVYNLCVNGATDTLTQEDRDAILKELQQLRMQVYKEGNADSAGRTLFTGYKTNSQLTFKKDELDTRYSIKEPLSYKDIEEKNYYSNFIDLPTDEAGVQQGVPMEDMPQEETNFRVRLSYDGIEGTSGNVGDVTLTDADGNALTYTKPDGTTANVDLTTKSYADWEADGFAVGDDEALFIPETGEIIFGKNISESLKGDQKEFYASYTKTGFREGELRPEHYFDCTNQTDPNPDNWIEYTKENQEIAYTVAFNQTIVVNTQADEVFNADMGRDVDELTDAVKAAIDAHDKLDKLNEMKKQEQYQDPELQAKLDEWIEAAEKETAYADDNMQQLFSQGIGNFQGYLDDVKLARTDVGSKGDRLELTKERVGNQQSAFETLLTTNEDRDISDVIMDFTSAYTAYQASLMASSKANQQTLLNYL